MPHGMTAVRHFMGAVRLLKEVPVALQPVKYVCTRSNITWQMRLDEPLSFQSRCEALAASIEERKNFIAFVSVKKSRVWLSSYADIIGRDRRPRVLELQILTRDSRHNFPFL